MKTPDWWSSWVEPHWKDTRYQSALDLLEKSPEKRMVRDWMLERFGSIGGRFVDFGSGNALAPRSFAELGNWQLTLTEHNEELAATLRAEFSEPHSVVVADLLNPQDEIRSINDARLVGMTHFLYHIERADWPKLFALANSIRAADGKIVLALRSPREFVNEFTASLGANIFDIEKDATAWAVQAQVPVECHSLQMSMEELSPEDVLTLFQFMLRDVPECELTRIPELDELRNLIEAELFDEGRCVWPYENSIVVLG